MGAGRARRRAAVRVVRPKMVALSGRHWPARCRDMEPPLPGTRLAFICEPLAGESFASWVDRSAAATRTPVGLVCDSLGLPRRSGAEDRPSFFGIAISTQVLADVASRTGCTPQAIGAMHLATYRGTVLSLEGLDPARGDSGLRRIRRGAWASMHGTRACPECLEHSRGVWRLDWKLSLTAICARHGRLLLDDCPRCGVPLRGTAPGAPRLMSRVHQVHPRACDARSRAGRCATDLSAVRTPVVTGPGVRAHELLRLAAAGAPTVIAGTNADPAQAHVLARALMAAVRFAADPGLLPDETVAVARSAFERTVTARGSRAGGESGYTDRPRSAPEALGLLAAVEAHLLAPDEESSVSALEGLCEAIARRRNQLGRFPLQRLPLPEVVLRAGASPMKHARVARMAPPAGAKRSADVQCVPELLDAPTYRVTIARYLPGTAELSGRTFAALAVARSLGARSWAQAGVVTGAEQPGLAGCFATPSDSARSRSVRIADILGRRITDVDGFWAAVRAVATDLEAADVDYRHRRDRLGGLTALSRDDLSPDAWQLLRPWTSTRARLAAAWLWTDVAGGDWRLSPALADTSWKASTESRRELYRQFTRRLSPAAAHLLREVGLEVVTRSGRVAGEIGRTGHARPGEQAHQSAAAGSDNQPADVDPSPAPR